MSENKEQEDTQEESQVELQGEILINVGGQKMKLTFEQLLELDMKIKNIFNMVQSMRQTPETVNTPFSNWGGNFNPSDTLYGSMTSTTTTSPTFTGYVGSSGITSDSTLTAFTDIASMSSSAKVSV